MLDLAHITGMLDAIILPIVGGCSLLLSKISQGELARQWERLFLLTLVVITFVTLRTVTYCDETWLIHTATLAAMIVGSQLVPNQHVDRDLSEPAPN